MPNDIDPTAILRVTSVRVGTIKATNPSNGETIPCLLLQMTGTKGRQPSSYDMAIPVSDMSSFIALLQDTVQRIPES
jgi:hypothetical protein